MKRLRLILDVAGAMVIGAVFLYFCWWVYWWQGCMRVGLKWPG